MRQRQNSRFLQRGVSMYGWMIIFGLVGFFALLGMRCVPVYLMHYDISSTMVWASKQPGIATASSREIQDKIQRRFDSGYVSIISARDIKVLRSKQGQRYLEVKYDRKVPFVYNIDLLFHFHTVAYLNAH